VFPEIREVLMAEFRRFYGGMKPVKRPEHEEEPHQAPPPPVPDPPKRDTRPLQKGTGEESVE
jgi:hypothetical protein